MHSPLQPQTQTLSWDEIRRRAMTFAHDWANAASEDAEAKAFWIAFFEIFGIARRKVASFEERVHLQAEQGQRKDGKIDLLWKGMLLIEHKSRGKSLEKAYEQAIDYFPGLKNHELPRYVLVCDFERFELHDLEPAHSTVPVVHSFSLSELPQKINLFDFFLYGKRDRIIRESDPVNQQAVEAIGELHDALKANGYAGQALEVFLVRLLFCLFADDTGIFQPKDSFHDLLEYHSRADGADMGSLLQELFETLNEPPERRQKNMSAHFALFPYVNGKLFEDHHRPPQFDSSLRQQLLALCDLDWGAISPAIFGAMFQTVIELEAGNRRRQLGAHYTSEANILKVIGPLFLDELRGELESVKNSKNALFEFHKKLRRLNFLDPACGCGNFLVIAYRELRLLELEVLREAAKFGARSASVFDLLQVNVDQFYGIEIEEFPAQIAQVAMWLTDHQMNQLTGLEFGEHIMRIPLTLSAHIRHGNALEIDWSEFVPPSQLSFIMGNPPFLGKNTQSATQKTSLESVTVGIKGAGVLDFVAGWYIKAAQYLSSTSDGFGGIAAKANQGRKGFKDVKFGQAANLASMGGLFADVISEEASKRRSIRCAFVSTNSITQGEQVGVLWSWLLAQGIHIQFAHRTFQWSNDAPGKAAVHCVIVGFGITPMKPRLFDYEDIQGAAHEIKAKNINPYLVDAQSLVLPSRRQAICDVPALVFGSMPNDGGGLLLDHSEKIEFLKLEPEAKAWIKPFLGAEEFLNNTLRWCLWLKDCPPATLKTLKHVLKRIEIVRQHRAKSSRETTVALAQTPALFGEDRQPSKKYLLIPSVSSENRRFIPIGFLSKQIIASNATLTITNASLYDFGILSSTMHNAWVRYTCGRLESRYRYSAGIVYNNYPWPQNPSDKAKQKIEAAAQGVLDERALHQSHKNAADNSSLATLYNPATMPANLVKAHQALDKAVDSAYQECEKSFAKQSAANADNSAKAPDFSTDATRVAYLFTLYERYTRLL